MKSEGTYRLRAFLGGCLLGAVCFVLIYGVRILNPTYDDWLLLGDMDLKQHYIGFCHYRVSSWQFPVGLIETLSYPNKMSVIYTDSIPGLAVLFKLFAYVLPQKFQYFGLAGLLSFILTGGFAGLLLYRFLGNTIASVIYSLFFIVSYPVIQRMYYHTALASHWILLAALCLWLYQEELSVRTRVLLWSGFGFLCVSIHSYFLPMVGLILLCAVADDTWTSRAQQDYAASFKPEEEIGGKKEKAKKTEKEGKDRAEDKRARKSKYSQIDRTDKRTIWDSLKTGAVELFGFCASAILALFIYGGFYGSSSAVGEGLGTFTSNLNTFVNPLDDGRLYGSLPTYNGFQYEGFGYLGGGILLLLMTGVVAAGVKYFLAQNNNRIFHTDHRPLIAAALFAVTCMLSMFPIVTLNDKKLFGVPYPGFVRKLLGIFRSNGRFIWTAVYLLMLLAITLCYRIFKQKLQFLYYILTILALGLQAYDISGMLAGKHDYFAKEQTYSCFWEDENELSSERKGFVFLYNENDILMDTAYFAYLNGMWQNNYYYARDINPVIDQNVEEWKETLLNGFVRSDIIYIFRQQDASPELLEGLRTFSLKDHVVGVRFIEENKSIKKGK